MNKKLEQSTDANVVNNDFDVEESAKRINTDSVEKLFRKLFGNVEIKSIEYLYNFDDLPDYVCVVSENDGYAIFHSESLALLEYAQQGGLPFPNAKERKYYGGPLNYFTKSEGCFINVRTKEAILVSASDAARHAKSLRELVGKK